MFSYWQELAARVNQSALEAVTPSPSFQQRHESMRPSRCVCVLSLLHNKSKYFTHNSHIPTRCDRPPDNQLPDMMKTDPWSPIRPSTSLSLCFPVKGVWAERAALALWAQSRRLRFLCSHWMLWSPRKHPSSLT